LARREEDRGEERRENEVNKPKKNGRKNVV
jgi:hypothetical protein